MTYTIQEIYRVVCTDQYQSTTPETCWTTDKDSCIEYIKNSYYKHCSSLIKQRIMTQEDKELLLKDLCARLPFHCRVFYEYVDDLDKKTYGYSLTLNTWCIDEFIANKAVIKPYLRSMSSMTEEERKKYKGFIIHKEHVNAQGQEWDIDCFSLDNAPRLIDWLNTHHFDYRGLIEKGLALAITKENNPYEN